MLYFKRILQAVVLLLIPVLQISWQAFYFDAIKFIHLVLIVVLLLYFIKNEFWMWFFILTAGLLLDWQQTLPGYQLVPLLIVAGWVYFVHYRWFAQKNFLSWLVLSFSSLLIYISGSVLWQVVWQNVYNINYEEIWQPSLWIKFYVINIVILLLIYPIFINHVRPSKK